MENEVKSFAYYAPDNRTRWQKFLCRLFPANHCHLPEAPAEYKDCVHFRSEISLSLKDRLRILVSGRATVDAQ